MFFFHILFCDIKYALKGPKRSWVSFLTRQTLTHWDGGQPILQTQSVFGAATPRLIYSLVHLYRLFSVTNSSNSDFTTCALTSLACYTSLALYDVQWWWCTSHTPVCCLFGVFVLYVLTQKLTLHLCKMQYAHQWWEQCSTSLGM